jgi:hypothetical protein
MWGAPASGKTTYLAALRFALDERESGWQLKGEDAESAESLTNLSATLDVERAFPSASGDLHRYRWSVVARDSGRRTRFRRGRRGEDVIIGLNLIDAPGAMATTGRFGRSEDLIESLADSSGILYLFDPVREYESGDSLAYTADVLTALLEKRPAPEGRLPHYVAVCVTKFDEPRVLTTAEKLRMITFDSDPPGFPRVPDADAEAFFTEISNASRSGSGLKLRELIERTFHPDRVRYFVTSAIGFFVDPRTGDYNPRDPRNVVGDARDERIRGRVRPINVAEPVLWLSERISADRGPSG